MWEPRREKYGFCLVEKFDLNVVPKGSEEFEIFTLGKTVLVLIEYENSFLAHCSNVSWYIELDPHDFISYILLDKNFQFCWITKTCIYYGFETLITGMIAVFPRFLYIASCIFIELRKIYLHIHKCYHIYGYFCPPGHNVIAFSTIVSFPFKQSLKSHSSNNVVHKIVAGLYVFMHI